MPRGGARPGAGRKKGYKEKQTISKELAREALRQIVLANMQDMTAAQISNAKGIKYLVKREKNGKFTKLTEAQAAALPEDGGEPIEIWEERPNVQAFTDLMNRALDKPKEQPQELVVNGTLNIASRLTAARQRLAKHG